MEPTPDSPFLDYIVYVVVAAVMAVLAKMGYSKKPLVEEGHITAVRGALVSDAAADKIVASNDRVAAVTERLCLLLEKEVGLRQSSVEEARRMEDQKRMALVVADQVREDILAEMRKAMEDAPAPMPTTRKRPPERS